MASRARSGASRASKLNQGTRGRGATGTAAGMSGMGVHDDDSGDEGREMRRYMQERRSEAWWARRPAVERDNGEFGAVEGDREEKEKARQRRMQQATHILERMMRQQTFFDGDQDLLAKAFGCIQADGSRAGRIDYDEFWEALAPISANMRDQDRQELFMKVDTECSGSVDLFDFLNFFLVTSYDQLQRPITRSGLGSRSASSNRSGGGVGRLTRASSVKTAQKRTNVSNEPTPSFYSQPFTCQPNKAGHKDVMIGIFRNKATDTYATVARDGTLSTWTKDLKFLKSCSVSDPRQNLGGNLYTGPGIITSSCYMPHSCLVGVSSMKRQLRFYDVGAPDRPGKKEEAVLIFTFRPQPRAVMSLECSWMNDGHEMLVCGDDEGVITYYKLIPGWHRMDGGAAASYNEKRFNTEMSKSMRYAAHKAWVTKAMFVDSLHSIASSGYDNVLSLFDLESSKTKWSLDASKQQIAGARSYAHTKGISTWDWSRQFNMFATGGVERIVSLWTPFVAKPVGSLQGHASSILQIMVNEKHNQILTLASDKCVRVWDIRNLKCISVLSDNATHLPENRFHAMYMDTVNEQLVLGSGRPHRHPMKRAISQNESVYGLTAVAVSSVKNLLATADEINEVRMWRAGSGRGVSTFNGCPTNGAQITALAFDFEHLRLFVAANDGVIRLCNHGNGLVLKHFHVHHKVDVHGLVSALERGESMLYAATEGGQLCCFKDTGEAASDRAIYPESVIKGGHHSDVLDTVTLPPDVVVSCSYDGRVVYWSGGHLRYVMTDPDHELKPSTTKAMVQLCILNIMRPKRNPNEPTPARERLKTSTPSSGGASESRDRRPRSTSPRKVSATESSEAFERRATTEKEGPADGAFQGMILTAGADGYVHFWDITYGKHAFKIEVFRQAKSSFGVLRVSADHTNSLLACGDAHGYVSVHDISGLAYRRAPESVFPLFKFRAHMSALLSANFIRPDTQNEREEPVLVTACNQEMRMWTAKGDHIGQFGRDHWDITSGVRNPLRLDDVQEEVFMEEDEGRSSALLSELIEREGSFMGSSINDSEEEIDEVICGDEANSPIAKVVESHLKFFASDDLLLPPGKSSKPVMPKDWKKPKKFDVNCFAKMTLKDLADPKMWREEQSADTVKPGKHTVRMAAAIRELNETPDEVRAQFVYDPSFVKPTTPQIFGLHPPRAKMRSHSSMT